MKKFIIPLLTVVMVVSVILAGCAQPASVPSPEPMPTPELAPATGRIAFQSKQDGNPEIYVMDADGSNQTRLTNNPAGNRDPAWSP